MDSLLTLTATWELVATRAGTFTLGANARDSAYPTPGEAHQASEGAGAAYATVSVITAPSIPAVPTVDFGQEVLPGVPTTISLGQNVQVRGQMLAPETTYVFRWKSPRGTNYNCQGEVVSDAQGNIGGQIELPSSVPFLHQGEGNLLCFDKRTNQQVAPARPLTIKLAIF